VLLAQALFGKPEALLLDAPTNNLDIDGIRWPVVPSSYEGVLVVIPHDRHFSTRSAHRRHQQTIITYPGGYDDMVMAKSQIRGKVEQENAERQKKIDQLLDFVARFAAGTRASQVQSRKKQIEKLQLADLKKSNIERPFIQFLVKKPSGKQTLTLDGLTKRWPGVTVCEHFSALVTKGEKVGIIGRSGKGKTTLCRMLLSELKPDGGKVVWGHQASVGYLAQDHREGIAMGRTSRTGCTPSITRPARRKSAGSWGRCSSRGTRERSPPMRFREARRCGSSSRS
jgi:ATPase subunit of ABC transporter with duplicated ATPase domains